MQLLLGVDAGGRRFGWYPETSSTLELVFDDAGTAQVLDGGYHDWDCLNLIYGGRVKPRSPGVPGLADIAFDGVFDFPLLYRDYLQLPHVLGQTEPTFVFDACRDGDLCLDISDAGTFRYLGWVAEHDCNRLWFRLTTQTDGGALLEVGDAGSDAPEWVQTSPECALHLVGFHRLPDGGVGL